MSSLRPQRRIITTTRDDLLAHFQALGLKPGMDVMVASSLYAFGYIDGDPGAVVYEALRTILGPQATIVVPTYQSSSHADPIWHAKTSPGANMGLLSEYVRCHHQSIRSLNPILSHAAIGPKADLLTHSLPTASYGPGSDFEILAAARFAMLLLGCSFTRGCAYLHHVEALVGVPYRHWVQWPRKIVRSDIHDIEEILVGFYDFCHPNVKDHFDAVPRMLDKQGRLSAASAPYGKSYQASLQDIDACGRDLLKQDPYALVTDRF